MVAMERWERTSAQKPSLQSAAYEAIKHRIVTCRYRPGEYLNEQQISDELGFGRTPVHQAVNRLSLEGLVEIIPRKGVIVKPLSLDEILDVSDIRQINEIHCAQLASQRLTADADSEFDEIIAESRDACEERDVERLMMLDRRFHGLIAATAGNAVLSDVLRNLHDRSLRHWFLSLSDPEHDRRVLGEHERIVQAIRSGDKARIAEAVTDHIGSFRKNLLTRI
ncbi:GntR family transcriptional regulator [Propylenella binzhouense]|uniref:GntR family transcriptional regulator n=1 Tax=Propylenella binzhouense TaxID=2555902 RepID=A0A964T2R9_9HYPH|nr:GntR family transcriptional regulator [Propylenella binzhouense]MYZ47386.1 GntR family transcriptional regulator [Propylenella binzhouense]